jgi:hypothetical protein
MYERLRFVVKLLGGKAMTDDSPHFKSATTVSPSIRWQVAHHDRLESGSKHSAISSLIAARILRRTEPAIWS